VKLNESKVSTAINEYIDSELVPMTANMGSLEQFTFGLTLGIFRRKLQGLVKKMLENKTMHVLGVVDEQGNIDVETAYLAASDVLKNGNSVEVGGIRFTCKDLDKLYSIMQRYA
jgi:hypothetical protein